MRLNIIPLSGEHASCVHDPSVCVYLLMEMEKIYNNYRRKQHCVMFVTAQTAKRLLCSLFPKLSEIRKIWEFNYMVDAWQQVSQGGNTSANV
jgi:hypothetical protein